MAEFPALSLWTDAYLADTTDLSAEEHGAYLLLLMAAWRSPDCALPDDDVRLARMARVGSKKWKNLRPVMERFWTVDARGWTQKRLLEERARIETLRSQNSSAGKASALKRKKTGSTSVGTEGATKKQLPIPCTSTSEDSVPSELGAERPDDEPDDLKTQVWGPILKRLCQMTGGSEKSLRPLVGKWMRDYGDGAVIEAVTAAARESPVDPRGWIEAALKRRAGGSMLSDDEIREAVLQ